VRFPSQPWADALRVAVNEDAGYAEVARRWEEDILLRVPPPGAEGLPSPGVHRDLGNGQCRSARFIENSRTTESEFVFEASEGNWREVLHRRIDPVPAILGGTLKVRGKMAKLLRFSRVARQLVHDVGTFPLG